MENNNNRQVKKGLWKPEEDLILKTYVETHGEGNWAAVSEKSGLMRGGKSCRLRWKNYLRPNIKRGMMSQEEEDLIIRMHKLLGNRWSLIAGRLPGRTDNEVKNYWNTHLNKRIHHTGKRKANGSDDKDTGNRNKRQRNSQSIPEEEKSKDQQDSTGILDSLIVQDAQSINNNIIESPIVPTNNNYEFVFDDDPFVAYLDSFFFFESFGYNNYNAQDTNQQLP